MKTGRLLTIALALLLSACASTGMPRPTESAHFLTEGGGFLITGGKPAYALTLQVKKVISSYGVWYAVVEFQNPEDASAPLVKEYSFISHEYRLELISEPLAAIQNKTNYRVRLKAYKDEAKTQLVATHDAYIRFELPEAMLQLLSVKLIETQ